MARCSAASRSNVRSHDRTAGRGSPVSGSIVPTLATWRRSSAACAWAWSGWEWAGPDGRFHGRWDDSQGYFRTIYAGSTLVACLLEVLAGFRPDPTLALDVDDIVEDEDDAATYPTGRAGEISYSWLEPRSAASATLTQSVATIEHHPLYPEHPDLQEALRILGLTWGAA